MNYIFTKMDIKKNYYIILSLLLLMITLLLISIFFTSTNVYSSDAIPDSSTSLSAITGTSCTKSNSVQSVQTKSKFSYLEENLTSAASTFKSFFSGLEGIFFSNPQSTSQIPTSIEDVLSSMKQVTSDIQESVSDLLNEIKKNTTTIMNEFINKKGIVEKQKLSLYKQILTDFKRYPYKIFDNTSEIHVYSPSLSAPTSNSASTVSIDTKNSIIKSLNMLKSILMDNLHKLINDKNKSLFMDNINQAILQAFASRTQTFEPMAMEIILKEIKKEYQDKIALRASERNINYHVIGNQLFATTKINYSLLYYGDGKQVIDFDIKGNIKGNLILERQRIFTFKDDGTFSITPEKVSIVKTIPPKSL
ncbi:MAG: hypothetical protein HQK51_03190 [Oligoflexia bacterium]|nr:hypothetical protein [Oligoflexia bacterium]